MGLGPEEIVIVWIAKPLICFKTLCIKSTKFLLSTHNFEFRILVFIIECNGEARRQSAKNAAGVFAMDSFPVCGTLRRIIACRLNVGIRIGEAHSIH